MERPKNINKKETLESLNINGYKNVTLFLLDLGKLCIMVGFLKISWYVSLQQDLIRSFSFHLTAQFSFFFKAGFFNWRGALGRKL